MKTTVKKFIQSLIGGKKGLKTIIKLVDEGQRVSFSPCLKFDGDYILIYCKEAGYDEDVPLDRISAQKKGGKLYIDLASLNYWFLTIEFTDGGLVKNKEYKIEDYIK